MKLSSFEKFEMQFSKMELGIYAIVVDAQFIERHPEDITHIEHTHDYIEITIICSGAGIQLVNGKEYKVKEGDVFILRGDDRHYFRKPENFKLLNIMLDPVRIKKHHYSFDVEKINGYTDLIEQPSTNFNGDFQRRLFLDKPDLVVLENLFKVLMLEFKSLIVGSRLIIKNKLEEILLLLIRKNSDVAISAPSPLHRISKAIAFMDNNYSKKITTQELAKLCYMSERNFARIFKNETKTSPNEYINKIRMKRARFYLQESDLAVNEIAAKIGIDDPFYFAKIFKNKTGYSPSLYRKLYKK